MNGIQYKSEMVFILKNAFPAYELCELFNVNKKYI